MAKVILFVVTCKHNLQLTDFYYFNNLHWRNVQTECDLEH